MLPPDRTPPLVSTFACVDLERVRGPHPRVRRAPSCGRGPHPRVRRAPSCGRYPWFERQPSSPHEIGAEAQKSTFTDVDHAERASRTPRLGPPGPTLAWRSSDARMRRGSPLKRALGFIFAVAMMVAMLLAPALVRAAEAPAAQADELVKQGFQLRLPGKNLEALELFNKAHQIAPSAKTLGQMGSVEVALHRWLEAEAHLTDALGRHDSPWVENPKNRGMLEKTLQEARKQIGRVRVTGTAGAEVFADGRRVGTLPLAEPVHAAAGTIRIRATAPGRQTAEKQVAVRGGEETSVALELLPVGSNRGAVLGPDHAGGNAGVAGAGERRAGAGALAHTRLAQVVGRRAGRRGRRRNRRRHRLGDRRRAPELRRARGRRVRAPLRHEGARMRSRSPRAAWRRAPARRCCSGRRGNGPPPWSSRPAGSAWPDGSEPPPRQPSRKDWRRGRSDRGRSGSSSAAGSSAARPRRCCPSSPACARSAAA